MCVCVFANLGVFVCLRMLCVLVFRYCCVCFSMFVRVYVCFCVFVCLCVLVCVFVCVRARCVATDFHFCSTILFVNAEVYVRTNRFCSDVLTHLPVH